MLLYNSFKGGEQGKGMEGRQCQERFSSCVIKTKGLKFIIHSSQMTSWNKSTRKSDVNKSSFKLFF